jgi:hypothetical protein
VNTYQVQVFAGPTDHVADLFIQAATEDEARKIVRPRFPGCRRLFIEAVETEGGSHD